MQGKIELVHATGIFRSSSIRRDTRPACGVRKLGFACKSRDPSPLAGHASSLRTAHPAKGVTTAAGNKRTSPAIPTVAVTAQIQR